MYPNNSFKNLIQAVTNHRLPKSYWCSHVSAVENIWFRVRVPFFLIHLQYSIETNKRCKITFLDG